MPCDYRKYPANWKAIRANILERAGNKCEQCKAPNRTPVFRGAIENGRPVYQLVDAKIFDANTGEFITEDPCYVEQVGDRDKATEVVLTISHTDHDVSNNDPDNLRALCQRCHLAHDRELHTKNAKATRIAKMGLQSLF
jgi:5-methylcytosine-specific restriction endonuclease McrA